jgi:hypothetical protein
MTKLILAAALGLVASTSIASAYDGHRYGYGHGSGSQIDRRQTYQAARIESGVRSGEITRSEYRRLQAEQAHIRQLEAQAKRDGHIDTWEAARIRRAQNEASQHIREEASDAQRRGWRRWW